MVVMIHPDYQYDPRLLLALVSPICYEVYDVMLGSRILGGGAVSGGMPRLKYYVNRALTAFQNMLMRSKLSEFHTGYRAFHRKVLETIPFRRNSNDFVFDNQILAQVIYFGFKIGEVSCPTRYFREASSIGLGRGIRYAWACVWTTFQYLFQKFGLHQFDLYQRMLR